ncbi:MAG TPA: hypothetical protein VFU37_05675 [Pyrinomonadaceae bacterium]|nr:hypothetical protein [Pyrinomonadaceae bacterium]
MKKQLRICLPAVWLAAAIIILIMGTDICVSTDVACDQAGQTMFLLMFWLSFPTGLVFALAALIFLDSGVVHSPSDFISAWMVMAFGGLMQWLVIVPRLFEEGSLTLLNLEARAKSPCSSAEERPTKLSNEVTAPAPASNPTVLKLPTPVPAKAASVAIIRTKQRRKTIKSISGFDRSGRTPLERVIDHL